MQCICNSDPPLPTDPHAGPGFEMEEDEEDDIDAHEGGVVVDPVDLYCAKMSGRLAVSLSAAVVGTLLGLALSAVRACLRACLPACAHRSRSFLSLLLSPYPDVLTHRHTHTHTLFPSPILLAAPLTATAHPQSIFHNPAPFAAGGAGIGLFLSLLRNDFGDLFRALGLMLIYLLERNRQGAGGLCG
jgi:hypothetical protein